MAEAPTETLRINTGQKRRRIIIDDKDFEILHMREMSLADKAKAITISKGMIAFTDGLLDAQGLKDLSQGLAAVVRVMVPSLDAGTDAQLTDDDRCSIVSAFCTPQRKAAPEGPSLPKAATMECAAS